MASLNGIAGTFAKWGVAVAPSEMVAGRPGEFDPDHVMVHHTASRGPSPNPSAEVVRRGRPPRNGDPGLPGPLCQVLVRRDFKVEIVSLGRANHAGLGSWPSIGEAGNTRCVGVEIEHAGTSAEEWTPEFMVFCRRVEAAILDHIGEGASRMLAHKEWAPGRKIDPFNWNMDSERTKVARLLADGPNLKDDDMTPQELLSHRITLTAAAARNMPQHEEGDEVSVAYLWLWGGPALQAARTELASLRADVAALREVVAKL